MTDLPALSFRRSRPRSPDEFLPLPLFEFLFVLDFEADEISWSRRTTNGGGLSENLIFLGHKAWGLNDQGPDGLPQNELGRPLANADFETVDVDRRVLW